ncbi:Hypothetical predicted protein [Mytilus galloprovincialis]|uniref:Ion transport domain-containing protein n=1 Tax=Mytilus galloprovincialis TaxID=29158 RepID=A0A8B6FYH5_MYTGA|nr:Hypothetical predicted protein [Mytilus galloprovincialis]
MKTVMKISANNELMQFMGTTACQTKLKSIWREHMSILTSREMICQREQRLLWHRICSWWTDNWNKFDAVMYIMYLLSVILRFSMKKDDFVWARMAYSVTLAFFILRTLQFFYVAKNTGPKIIMIGKMMTDLQFFIMIFAVVLVSFGIITQANLYPNSEPTFQLLTNVVYLPYWQMYGELFLETIEGQESSTCTTESSVYRNGTLPRCPESTAIVPIVLAVYMVLTNLMLLNLLIAMFS